MRFEVTQHYPAAPDVVAEMLTDDVYIERAATDSGALHATHEVVPHDDGAFVISALRRLPTDTIPASMRSLVGSSIELRIVQAWSPASVSGGRNATMTINITGAPARCTAQAQLRPDDPQGTMVTYAGEVQVPIPLLGPSVEQTVVQAIKDGLATEHRAGLAHLGED